MKLLAILLLSATCYADDPELIRLRVEVASLRAQLSVLQSTQAQDAPAVPESPTTPARFEPSPAVLSPQPPADVTPSSPGVQTLRERIRAYRDSGGQRWYEERGGQLTGTSKAHLNLEHGWAAIDVHGLTQDELDLLHGASHTGRITKDGKVTTTVATNPKNVQVAEKPPREQSASKCSRDGIPVERRADGRDYWLHPVYGWRYATGALQEGGEYIDLIYRDGRMWPKADAPAKATPKITPVIPQPSGYWAMQQQCVGGQCQMVPVWIPNR